MKNFIAVKISEEKATASGILLADTVEREKPQMGEITHVGGVDSDFSIGDTVLFEKYGAIEIKMGQEVLHIVDKRDVIGIMSREI